MIRTISLPMFIASSINFLFFLFYFILSTKTRHDQKFYKSYIIFSILSLVNSIYGLTFGILLNSGSNLNILNITNRITIITCTFVLVLFIHFIIIFFNIKGKITLYILYIINTIFAIVTIIDNPLFLYKEFFTTSKYYTGLKFGILFQIWGIYILFLLISALLFLIYGFRQLYKKKNHDIFPIIFLLISSISWIIAGGLDAMTAVKLIDLPPLSWIGSLSIVLSIAIVLIVTIEQLYEKNQILYEEVIHDNLTNAFSRSFFDLEFDNVYKSLNRTNSSNFIVLLDIDNFKEINDTFGHLAGDFILFELACIIKKNLRSTDILSRFGGDEFVILIKESKNTKKTLALINRIKEHIDIHIFNYKNKKLKLTCSFGVSNFDQSIYHSNINKDKIFAAADTALYKSKEKGKNRIEFINPLELNEN